MAVTVSTIAKHLGLSRQTVAFVLGDRPHLFREETQQRVFAAAEKLGYRRNAAALAMSRGRYNAVGLLQSSIAGLGLVHVNFLGALMAEVRVLNMHLSIGQVDDATLVDEKAMPELMNAWAVDGLIISYVATYPQRLVDILHRYRLPAIWTNVKRDVDAVYVDDYAGARDVTERLLSLGHRRIAFVRNYDSVHYSSHDRWTGYSDAMLAAGLIPRRIGTDLSHLPVTSTDAYSERLREMRVALGAGRPTAVIVDDEATCPILIQLCGMLGLKLGSDVSLVNVTREETPILGQHISTAVVPTGALGHAAIPMLTRKIESRFVDMPSETIRYSSLHADATCGPPAE